MATETFDRPLRLTEEETIKFLEVASRPPKPYKIKPYSEADRRECEGLLEKHWFKNKKDKME